MNEIDFERAQDMQEDIATLRQLQEILTDGNYYPVLHSDTCTKQPSVTIENTLILEGLISAVNDLFAKRTEEFEKL